MKFLTEVIDNPLSLLMEADATGKKNLYIQGPFAVAESKNKNGRIYKKEILEGAINKYDSDYIKNARALGEMNHPARLNIDYERATHMITEMKQDGNVWIGKAKVLNTPMGSILKGLLESGVNVGVSTRGAGSITEANGIKQVGADYFLTAVDVVSDPSGPGCTINGIMEGMEYELDSKGQAIIEDIAAKAKRDYDRKVLTEARKIELFRQLLEAIK
jgi:hypothetical protein